MHLVQFYLYSNQSSCVSPEGYQMQAIFPAFALAGQLLLLVNDLTDQ